MSRVTVSRGSAWNSSHVHERRSSTAPRTVKVHVSSGACGVGPAESTGKSCVTYWPGGMRDGSASTSRRPRKPREICIRYLLVVGEHTSPARPDAKVDWLLVPRHSRAALRAAANRDSQRNIAIALVANVAVAGAKLAAGLLTGSSALLAEAAHSTADSVNEVILGLSLRRSRRPADDAHPFGYGGTRFLWAFLAAIFSFLLGGCVSIALAVHELRHPSEIGRAH